MTEYDYVDTIQQISANKFGGGQKCLDLHHLRVSYQNLRNSSLMNLGSS